ncbi:TIGR02444 family protein [Labrys monachus]|uniref:Uncharacterized protein (TIGR02444 family) n=1 Tax=Labrys monachus TaxID=217067 RepID=A0ABU0FF86_9HYPH|nr:TIGR02444 family protein [Labrys monachus]MDQ0393279.1 uncharacterized protein (TIGR02444 family) [Labrys monachus]
MMPDGWKGVSMGGDDRQAGSTDSREISLDNRLWHFALDFYGREGVAPACLALQDGLGVDVNILLLAVFAQIRHGAALGPRDLAAADALVRDWRTGVVHALRRLRLQLKSGPDPAPSPLTDGLRSEIKAAELRSEQIEIALLSAWLDRTQPRPDDGAPAAETVPAAVARHFAPDAAALQAPAIAEALEVLRRAIRQAGGDRPTVP